MSDSCAYSDRKSLIWSLQWSKYPPPCKVEFEISNRRLCDMSNPILLGNGQSLIPAICQN